MFTSLRARLWFTYALLSLIILCVVGTGLLVYLIRNPPATGRTYQRLELLGLSVARLPSFLGNNSQTDPGTVLQRLDTAFDARIIVLDSNGTPLIDTRASEAPTLPKVVFPILNAKLGASSQERFRFLDSNGRVWLYVARRIEGDRILIIAAPRPTVKLVQILREELIPPLFRAGLGAIILAIPLALWMAHWAEGPLQRMTKATHALAMGKHEPIPVNGPTEVQELASSFNEMSAQVQAAQQSQRELVANVSHDLKTPLTSIQGFAQAILDGTAQTPEQLHQAASVIHSESARMNRMVLDLLELARIDAGIADFKRQPVDLVMVLQALVEKLLPQASQAQVILETDLNPLAPITGDEDRLIQAFTNLVDNAIKFTPAQGKIVIRTRQISDRVEVTIADTGAGIPDEDLPHIFERFYQADKSRSRVRSGSGLGLPIAHEIIQAHSGSIHVQSMSDKGSTFTITLPIVRPDDPTLIAKRSHRRP